jgi:hypothetical protein
MSPSRRLPSSLCRLLALCCAVAALVGCSSGQRKQTVAEKAQLKDQTITEQQLDLLSNAFSDRYYTLMLSASERVMRDNPSLEQRRLMNGLRLLSVSSMYDIATSPDTVTQLVDQLVVVTLQNYFWVDSGRSQVIWGERAQFLVENLRRAREDIWAIAGRVFTEEQLNELDLSIATWWSQRGGTEFVAYVRFSEVASVKGEELVEKVRDGGGLLEPLDRATEQVERANDSADRAFFWAKRLPLFANWQFEALMYDIMIMPDTQRAFRTTDGISEAVAQVPERMKLVVSTIEGAQQTARDVVDRVFARALALVGAVFAGVAAIIFLRNKRKA